MQVKIQQDVEDLAEASLQTGIVQHAVKDLGNVRELMHPMCAGQKIDFCDAVEDHGLCQGK